MFRVPMLAHCKLHRRQRLAGVRGFVARWNRRLKRFVIKYLGKINGAVGNFSIRVAAYPNADWPQILFVLSLGFLTIR